MSPREEDRAAAYARLRTAIAGRDLPLALVDLDAFEANVDAAVRLAAGKPLRLATKSIRSIDLVRRALARAASAARGLLAFSAREVERLVAEGFDDVLLAYPIATPGDAARLAGLAARGARVVATADAREHLELLDGAAREARAKLAVCVDVDVSYRPAPGVHLGARRSPLHDAGDVALFAASIAAYPNLVFKGVQAYEAHVAGLPDRAAGARGPSRTIAAFKRLAIPAVRAQRAAIARELDARGLRPRIWNGGGTGSLASSTEDPVVNELSAGSAFLDGHLFDGYRGLALRPAALFALSVTRLPGPGFATCQGGGFVASGAPGVDRLPLPWLPEGLELVRGEGAGEVQTPLRLPRGTSLAIGAPVFFRHAKSGELAERFDELVLVRGDRVEGVAATYRGLGLTFH